MSMAHALKCNCLSVKCTAGCSAFQESAQLFSKGYNYLHYSEGFICPSTDEWLMRKNEIMHLQQCGWTRSYCAKWNKSVRERQIPYVFAHMWNLRKLTKDHEGREGGKNSYKQRKKDVNRKRILNTENKLRINGRGWREGSGWWALRRALVGMSTGCCM